MTISLVLSLWSIGRFLSLLLTVTTFFDLLFVYFLFLGYANWLQIVLDCSRLFLFVLLVRYGCSPILYKIFWDKLRHQAKLDMVKKFWYFIGSKFWMPVPGYCFCRVGWALDRVPMRFWSFPKMLSYPKILSLKSFGNSQGYTYIKSLY